MLWDEIQIEWNCFLKNVKQPYGNLLKTFDCKMIRDALLLNNEIEMNLNFENIELQIIIWHTLCLPK